MGFSHTEGTEAGIACGSSSGNTNHSGAFTDDDYGSGVKRDYLSSS